MAFVPWVLAFGIEFLHNKSIKSIILCAVAGLLMCLAQPRALFATIIIALPFIIQYLVTLFHEDRKLFRNTMIGLGGAVLAIVATVGIYVVSRLKSELLWHPENWFPGLGVHEGWLNSVWQYISGTAWYLPTGWLIAAALIVTLIVNVVWHRKLKTGKFLILWAIFGILYVLAAAGEFGLAKLFTAPWYKNPWRISAILPIIMIPMILAAVNLLAVKINRAKKVIPITLVVLSVLLLVFNGQNWQMRKELVRQTATDNPYAMLSDQKIATYQTVRDITESDAIVIADPFTGAPLDYALTGQELLFPIQNPRLENSADMQNMLAGWNSRDIGQICAVRPNQPKYLLYLGEIYTDFDPIYHTYDVFRDTDLHQNFMERGWLTAVKQFASGQEKPFTLYKINCK
jgi:hypothetical protein